VRFTAAAAAATLLHWWKVCFISPPRTDEMPSRCCVCTPPISVDLNAYAHIRLWFARCIAVVNTKIVDCAFTNKQKYRVYRLSILKKSKIELRYNQIYRVMQKRKTPSHNANRIAFTRLPTLCKACLGNFFNWKSQFFITYRVDHKFRGRTELPYNYPFWLWKVFKRKVVNHPETKLLSCWR
jgi:hypothetical protein